MSITNLHDLFSYTTHSVSQKVQDTEAQFDTKQKKITGAASSLVSEHTSLSINLCIYANSKGKLTVDNSIGTDKLPYLDDLDKPITQNFTDLSGYLQKSNDELQSLISFMSTDITNQQTSISESREQYFQDFNKTIVLKLFNSSLDDVKQGHVHKFITDNIHNGDLTINGTLSTSNILVKGDTFDVHTDVYKTSKVEIKTLGSETEPTLKITNITDTTNTNVIELKSHLVDGNVLTVSSLGLMGINKEIPTHSLDVDGIININSNLNFKVNNANIAFQDLDIPLTFAPSEHAHDMSEITNLTNFLNEKQDKIEGIEWDESRKTLDVSKNLNLGNGFNYQINGVNISTSTATEDLWDSQIEGTVTRGLVDFTPYNISIDGSDSSKKGIFLNEGNIMTYSGDIQTKNGSVESMDVNIDNEMVFGIGNNKWKIHAYNDDNYDLKFENSTDNGLTWNLRAKMRGATEYGTTVYTNFTGIHHCKGSTSDIYSDKYIGYIVSTTTKQFGGMNSIYSPENIKRHFDTNSWDFLPVVSLSSKPYDKSIFGIIRKVEGNDPNERYEESGNMIFPVEKKEFDRRLHIAGAGEGGIWVCDHNGILNAGDFITTSPIPGIGMRQDSDIVHNYTVGKITMDCDFNPKLLSSTSNIEIQSDISTSNNSFIETYKYEYEYDIRYLNSNGIIIPKNEYNDLQTSNIPVYKMAFVGCSYNCS